MKWFMFKAFFLASLMFLAVLFGMQQANEGITKMKGFHDESFKGAFTFHENDTGDLQASILGKDVSSHDLQQKKEKLEEMKAYNLFSSMGKTFSDSISAITDNIIHFITDLIRGQN
ncbi:YqxA family protein [Bacillus sp. S/N-304-OC-R1]|uniref:YqxA family protein n=1 Tax=Bacillus sp. S/N-304-OC-R1 TaxID=2758034 RepID=UPI001C8F10B0|nr:YqxA family protein [Bacillus sp. S/N-304-OC-R1]MBY0122351.1 YqxA family protein [Bacillus sp. S/N-304-OC-R1]